MEYTLEELSYPTGKYISPQQYSESDINRWLHKLEAAPKWYDYVIENLDEDQLNTAYKPYGWTINQIIHHVADSHMNAYIRVKMALTHDNVSILPYDQDQWATLPDVAQVPVNISITLLHSLHRRWVALFKAITTPQFDRTYFHPEQNKSVPLWEVLSHYAWHGQHHFEQIIRLRERMSW